VADATFNPPAGNVNRDIVFIAKFNELFESVDPRLKEVLRAM